MINEPKLATKDNIQSTYAYKQEVEITTGFYRGRKGTVEAYDSKTKKYTIHAFIDDRKHVIICTEDELKPKKGWFFKR